MKKSYIIFCGICLINTLSAIESNELSKQIHMAWHEIFGSQKPSSLIKVSPEQLINFGRTCFIKIDNFNDQLWKEISSCRAQKQIGSLSCLIIALVFYLSQHEDYYGVMHYIKIFYLSAAYMPIMEDAYLQTLYADYGDRMKGRLISEEH